MNTEQSQLASRTAQKLRAEGLTLEAIPSLLGFDGFIDTIYHVVDTRESATEYTRLRTLDAYGQRIVAAAGKSTNVEIVQQDVKLGGNGPIMANAMSALGLPITYVGMTGYPHLNEVFREFSERARLLPISDPALTDAIEFEDGKLIVGKHATVAEVSYDTIMQRVGEDTWHQVWQEAKFIGMVNWTMLPYLTHLWKRLQDDYPNANGPRKTMFFDLADPEKRTREDLVEALETVAAFQQGNDVILGLNEKEALQVIRALSIDVAGHGRSMIADVAAAIRARLDIHVCVVHPTEFAAAANADSAVVVTGPFTPQPKITTGAGDHFNAGFCCGQLLGCTLEESLQMGVATSGYYVRNAASPTQAELAEFLESLATEADDSDEE
ncbi:MAG: carbohydrate kinase family protein [Abitibacteriaceae bacterium]|nr:carbohydrate kinase family protein [Abditibacteriaceae bacterium]MBV9866652.1 carbohydrate kinase family protein [Abditibacteriaceae bacterium]